MIQMFSKVRMWFVKPRSFEWSFIGLKIRCHLGTQLCNSRCLFQPKPNFRCSQELIFLKGLMYWEWTASTPYVCKWTEWKANFKYLPETFPSNCQVKTLKSKQSHLPLTVCLTARVTFSLYEALWFWRSLGAATVRSGGRSRGSSSTWLGATSLLRAFTKGTKVPWTEGWYSIVGAHQLVGDAWNNSGPGGVEEMGCWDGGSWDASEEVTQMVRVWGLPPKITFSKTVGLSSFCSRTGVFFLFLKFLPFLSLVSLSAS